jgi:hypothetical protein
MPLVRAAPAAVSGVIRRLMTPTLDQTAALIAAAFGPSRTLDRQAVLVLGMHRSGTSAIAGTICALGATPPNRMLPASTDNPLGYWEPVSVVVANDRTLLDAGSAWWDYRFDCSTLDAVARHRAVTFMMMSMKAEFDNESRLVLLKDPRMCLLLDLWLPTLKALNISPAVVLVTRHPNDVIASLEKRDGLPAAYSTALWLRYNLSVEQATRGYRRCVLSYEDLLRDWRGALRLAGETISVSWPVDFDGAAARIDNFLRSDYRHHNCSTSLPIGDPLERWRDDVYRELLAREPGQRLDQVRTEFGEWCRSRNSYSVTALLDGHPIHTRPAITVPPEWDKAALMINRMIEINGPPQSR